ncbi:MAG TPA: glycosyltransferase [Candidatus Kryptonia bacterium]
MNRLKAYSAVENSLSAGAAPSISLVIAVYNKPEVLRCALAACARQSVEGFEVIVADDGSAPAIAEVVREAKESYHFPITHLWHEDRGWRKNIMLNNAIRASKSDYLVFIDGDCIAARDFLKDHLDEREPHRLLLGRRVEMSERWAEALNVEKIASGRFERIGLFDVIDGVRGKAARLEDGIRIKNTLIRKLIKRDSDKILGSNFSVHKSDLVAVNGFDEAYDGPGHGEDSDIQYRLSLVGVTGKSLRNLAIQFHVFHTRTMPSDRSVKRFEEVRKSGDPRCKLGLEKL